MAQTHLEAIPGLYERGISAGFGAFFTSLVVTPFDVIKTRQQVFLSASLSQSNPKLMSNKRTQADHNRKMHSISNENGGKVNSRTTSLRLGIIQSFRTILKYEGISGLYRGLSPTMMMAIPNTILYFSSFDIIRAEVKKYSLSDWFEPLFAGSTARFIAATSISPLELVRTQMQAQKTDNKAQISLLLSRIIKENGFLSLWKGLGPTLWRDLPFSAIYWLSYEKSKILLNHSFINQYGKLPSDFIESYIIPFIAGAWSGFIAAFITTPFDVVKTQRQVYLYNKTGTRNNLNTIKSLHHIVSVDGIPGLFRGCSARLIKVIPACAIMVSTYEFGKKYFSRF